MPSSGPFKKSGMGRDDSSGAAGRLGDATAVVRRFTRRRWEERRDAPTKAGATLAPFANELTRDVVAVFFVTVVVRWDTSMGTAARATEAAMVQRRPMDALAAC